MSPAERPERPPEPGGQPTATSLVEFSGDGSRARMVACDEGMLRFLSGSWSSVFSLTQWQDLGRWVTMEPLLRFGWNAMSEGEARVGIVEVAPSTGLEGRVQVTSRPAPERGERHCHLLSRPATQTAETPDGEGRCEVCGVHASPCGDPPDGFRSEPPVCLRHGLMLEREPTPCCRRLVLHCPDCCEEAIAEYVRALLEREAS